MSQDSPGSTDSNQRWVKKILTAIHDHELKTTERFNQLQARIESTVQKSCAFWLAKLDSFDREVAKMEYQNLGKEMLQSQSIVNVQLQHQVCFSDLEPSIREPESRSRPALRISDIPTFSGEELRQWIGWMDDFFDREGFRESEKLTFSQSFIDGEAESFVNRMWFEDWGEMKRALWLKFGNLDDQESIQLTTENKRCLGKFVTKIDGLDMKATPSVSEEEFSFEVKTYLNQETGTSDGTVGVVEVNETSSKIQEAESIDATDRMKDDFFQEDESTSETELMPERILKSLLPQNTEAFNMGGLQQQHDVITRGLNEIVNHMHSQCSLVFNAGEYVMGIGLGIVPKVKIIHVLEVINVDEFVDRSTCVKFTPIVFHVVEQKSWIVAASSQVELNFQLKHKWKSKTLHPVTELELFLGTVGRQELDSIQMLRIANGAPVTRIYDRNFGNEDSDTKAIVATPFVPEEEFSSELRRVFHQEISSSCATAMLETLHDNGTQVATFVTLADEYCHEKNWVLGHYCVVQRQELLPLNNSSLFKSHSQPTVMHRDELISRIGQENVGNVVIEITVSWTYLLDKPSDKLFLQVLRGVGSHGHLLQIQLLREQKHRTRLNFWHHWKVKDLYDGVIIEFQRDDDLGTLTTAAPIANSCGIASDNRVLDHVALLMAQFLFDHEKFQVKHRWNMEQCVQSNESATLLLDAISSLRTSLSEGAEY